MKLAFCSIEWLAQNLRKVLEQVRLHDSIHMEEQLHMIQRRENVCQVLWVSILLVFAMIPGVIVGNGTEYLRMNELEMILFLLGDTLLMGGFALGAARLLSGRRKTWYQMFYLSFWGMVVVQAMYLACRTDFTYVGLVLFLGMVLVLGGVPYFTQKERMLVLGILTGFGMLLYWRHTLMGKELFSLVSWGYLGLWIGTTRYRSYIRECYQERELKEALQDAETDPLTKLLNRRGLERSLRSLMPYCVRNHVPVGVFMIDIDNFKRYNDTFGHLEGDKCIKAVAQEIRKATKRKVDVAARVGGEEFLVFLTDVNENSAIHWARKLQESIEELAIPQARGNFVSIVTISVGVCCKTMEWGEEFQTLRELADEELYNAKENGRACISSNRSCYRSKKMEEERKNKLFIRKRV